MIVTLATLREEEDKMADTMSTTSHISITKLDVNNYDQWKMDAELMLRECGLYGFVDETEHQPKKDATQRELTDFNTRAERARALLCLAVSQ